MRKTTSTNIINKTSLERDCAMAYTIARIGGRWKLSILGVLHDDHVVRYGEMKSKLPGISERMLTLQLKELERDGLIVKNVYAEVPTRVEYQLSLTGKSLSPVFKEMTKWGEDQGAGVGLFP